MGMTKYIQTVLEAHAAFDDTKCASWVPGTHVPPDIEEFIDALAADPRFVYLHITAMTAGDKYGQNINGDIFTEPELCGVQDQEEALRNLRQFKGRQIPRYKTFEAGRFFRLHNNRPTSPSYGDIALAAWHKPLCRVDVIARIAKEDIPEMGYLSGRETLKKYDKDGYVSTSMGCRIMSEECTVCGQRKPFVRQRCHHLKNQMGRILPGGKRVGAINYGPLFFDLSDVLVPADKNALSIQKVASASYPWGDDLNPAVDDEVKKSRDKKAEICKIIPAHVKTLRKGRGGKKRTVETPATDMTTEELMELAEKSGFDMQKIAATATLCGVVLSPIEFAVLGTACSEYKGASSFEGVSNIWLSDFSLPVFDTLKPILGTRSGFNAYPAMRWEANKVAAAGYAELVDSYSAYRHAIDSLPEQSVKTAMRTDKRLQPLHGGELTKIDRAIDFLVNAGT